MPDAQTKSNQPPAKTLVPSGRELIDAVNNPDVDNGRIAALYTWTSKSGKRLTGHRHLTSNHQQASKRKLRGGVNLTTLTEPDLCSLLMRTWGQRSSDYIVEEVERGRLPAPISFNPVLWSKAEVSRALEQRRIEHHELIYNAGSGDPTAWKGNVSASPVVDHNALERASIDWVTSAIRQLNRPIAYEMTLSFPISGTDADKSDAETFNQRHDRDLKRLNNQLVTEAYRAVGLRRIVSDGYFHIIVPETKSASGARRRWHWHSILFLNEEEFLTFARLRPFITQHLLRHCQNKVAKAQIEYQPVDLRYVPYALKHAADNLTDIRTNIPGLTVNTSKGRAA